MVVFPPRIRTQRHCLFSIFCKNPRGDISGLEGGRRLDCPSRGTYALPQRCPSPRRVPCLGSARTCISDHLRPALEETISQKSQIVGSWERRRRKPKGCGWHRIQNSGGRWQLHCWVPGPGQRGDPVQGPVTLTPAVKHLGAYSSSKLHIFSSMPLYYTHQKTHIREIETYKPKINNKSGKSSNISFLYSQSFVHPILVWVFFFF